MEYDKSRIGDRVNVNGHSREGQRLEGRTGIVVEKVSGDLLVRFRDEEGQEFDATVTPSQCSGPLPTY